jgi:hypothetical protein
MNLMNYNYLVETENTTKMETERDRAYWFERIPQLIDSLFESNYFIKWDTNWNNENNFIVFANSTYQNVPYMFRSLELLYNKGYYLESSILIRTLYEMFVKVRYFHRYKDKCLPYSQKSIKIQYKKMFDEFSPGLYKILYGQLLSELAHGGYGVGVFRNKLIPPNICEPIMGNYYDNLFSDFTINFCTQLFYGYLNYIPTFFKQYEQLASEKIKEKRKKNIKWLEDRIDDQIHNNPRVEEYYKLLYPLIKL